MNLQTVNKDIEKLEKAVKLVESADNYMHFKKSTLIFDLCEQINVLKEKRDRQIEILETLKN
jgi:hypothetical protein